MKRAILYARVSGDDRKNATSSIESQLADCRAYAKQRGYSVVAEHFEEPDKFTSGAGWLPELDQIVRRAPSRTFDVLICREVDRLARNRFKQLSVEVELQNHDVIVEYVVGQFEDSPEGRLLKGLMSEFAEFEREKTRTRTHSGRLRSVKAGNVNTGSMPPYGYESCMVDGRRALEPCKEQAAVVQMIFTLYARDLYSMDRIASYLAERKVARPTAGRRALVSDRWSVGAIAGVIKNEIYVGRWHYRKTMSVKDAKTGKRRDVARPREEWLAIAVPPIVSEELFEAAQQRKQANKVQLGRQRKYEYLLGGMVQCAECSGSMSGITSIGRGKTF